MEGQQGRVPDLKGRSDIQNIAATNADDGGQTFHEHSAKYVTSIDMSHRAGSVCN